MARMPAAQAPGWRTGMLIAQILEGKGKEVVTVGPDVTAGELAAVLAEHNIGSAVVIGGDGEIVGIVSERDLARGLVAHGDDLAKRNVGELMSRDVVSCSRGDDLRHLMQLMTERRIRHLPVVEEGQLVGIISIGDVVKHRLMELEAERESLQAYITTSY